MSASAPMRDHWWWRPGWKVGRSFYTWHFTFADQPQVAELLARYGTADGFRAHVTLGYSNSAGPAAPVAHALDKCGSHTAEVTISTVSLINLNRDHKAHEWSDVATVRLGSDSPST
ncbi:hypothetical protein [Actinokineospora pegani]|uniref:hypothetical protein n=1 Tax=Actinokineospora pegani TaxID=2654637 RepID=UPI0018D4248A|nr:hypothetical protein [Actinokineospora pegani]